MLPEAGSVLGVDVGFSALRRSSAVCRLDWSGDSVTWTIARFRAVEPEWSAILTRLADRPLLAAAFDGPLRRGFDVIGRYRAAERMLTVGFGAQIGKPGQSSAPVGRQLNEAANRCAAIVKDTGHLGAARHGEAIDDLAIVEAFPSSFLGVLIEQPRELVTTRADRSDVFYQHLAESGGLERLLAHLLPGRSAQDVAAGTNHDDRASLVCAITALGVAKRDYVAVGDDDGWIILPPPSSIQPWAAALLETNSKRGCGSLNCHFLTQPRAENLIASST